jgi:hypothetical protein
MKNLRLFVELGADAVTAELAHHRVARLLGMLLDRMADVAEVSAGAHLGDTEPEAFESDFAQPARLQGGFADLEHAAAVAVIAVADHRHIEIDDVAVAQLPIAGDPMAYLVVDRGADRLRIRPVARRRVVEGRRNAA